MEKKYNKELYYCHNFRGIAVMGEAFETLAHFKKFAKEHGMQVAFCPLNHASTMVSNLKVLTPDQYKQFVNPDLDAQENADWDKLINAGILKSV